MCFKKMAIALQLVAVFPALFGSAVRGSDLINVLLIPGDQTDDSAFSSPPTNRLGGFMSDLAYHWGSDTYFGITDRGPGGGTLPYTPRIQQFRLDVDRMTGAAGGFQLQRTILFMSADGSETFDGRHPTALNGSSEVLGLSFDPEALVVAPNGHFYVADEYGPSLYEFAPVIVGDVTEARFVRSFDVPARFSPIDSLGQTNYVAERETFPSLVSGRQDNRGFEGLAMSPDGSTLFATMQDPLAEEGAGGQGRRSRNVRIVRLDVATGAAAGEFIYQLEDIATINARIPLTANDFTANQQGRQIGVSSLVAIDDHTLLALERDTRGLNPETLVSNDPLALTVGTKRLYEISLDGATDVSALSLAGTNALPLGTVPVAKTLVLDIQAALVAAGRPVPERMEGLAIGPQLADGSYSLVIGTDNDFSTADVGGTLSDVFLDGTWGPLGGDPMGRTLFPSQIFMFRSDLPDFVRPVPEPNALALVCGGIFVLVVLRRPSFLRPRRSRAYEGPLEWD